MSNQYNRLNYSAAEGLKNAPRSVQNAIRINLIVTFWMPILALAISDYYLEKIPNFFVVIFSIALFVLFSKMYEDTTRFSHSPIIIHCNTFSTLAILLFVSFYKNWPLELVIAEAVAIEMLAFLSGIILLYTWIMLKRMNKKPKNDVSKSSVGFLLIMFISLCGMLALMYLRFEGLIVYFIKTLDSNISSIVYLIVPFIIVVLKYLIVCKNHILNNDEKATTNNAEIAIISLNYGVPMLLNLIVPLVMHLLLYYEPNTT